jgi:hypothetical protein
VHDIVYLALRLVIRRDIEHLTPLLQKLGDAINETVNNSISISNAMEEIQNAGFNAFLVLEATINFKRREDMAPDEMREPKSLIGDDGEVTPDAFTGKDDNLLRDMKIRLD